MKKIYLLFYRPTDLIGKAISVHQRGGFCHVATYFQDDGDIIEAAWPKVRHRQIGDALDNAEKEGLSCVAFYEATDTRYKMALYFARAQIGKRYDSAALVGFLFRSSREQRKQAQRWTCSELALCISERADCQLLNVDKPHFVSPGHLSWSPIIDTLPMSVVARGALRGVVAG